MNEDTFCNELRHKFDRIKDKRAEWLPFRYYCMESIEKFERLNTEKTGAISQQTLEIAWNYYNEINTIISESRQIPNEQAIQMLTEILEQPTTSQTEAIQTEVTIKVVAKLPDVIHWSGHDKARFLSKVFPNNEPKQLAKDYWIKLGMKNENSLYGNLKRYRNNEIKEPVKIPIPEGIAAMRVFLGL